MLRAGAHCFSLFVLIVCVHRRAAMPPKRAVVAGESNILVAVRVRPMNKSETEDVINVVQEQVSPAHRALRLFHQPTRFRLA